MSELFSNTKADPLPIPSSGFPFFARPLSHFAWYALVRSFQRAWWTSRGVVPRFPNNDTTSHCYFRQISYLRPDLAVVFVDTFHRLRAVGDHLGSGVAFPPIRSVVTSYRANVALLQNRIADGNNLAHLQHNCNTSHTKVPYPSTQPRPKPFVRCVPCFIWNGHQSPTLSMQSRLSHQLSAPCTRCEGETPCKYTIQYLWCPPAYPWAWTAHLAVASASPTSRDYRTGAAKPAVAGNLQQRLDQCSWFCNCGASLSVLAPNRMPHNVASSDSGCCGSLSDI